MRDISAYANSPTEEHDACGIGFLADLGGPASHGVVESALAAVGAMSHRGARAADGRTGDGAGILCETPRAFLARRARALGIACACCASCGRLRLSFTRPRSRRCGSCANRGRAAQAGYRTFTLAPPFGT